MPLYSKRSADLLPKAFAEFPLVEVLTSLMDNNFAEIDDLIEVLTSGGIVLQDEVGNIRSKELGVSTLVDILSGGDDSNKITMSKLTELFSTIKGTKKAITLVFLLLGIRADVRSYRDIKRDEANGINLNAKYGLSMEDMKPCEVIVVGTILEGNVINLQNAFPDTHIDVIFELLSDEILSICTKFFSIIFIYEYPSPITDLEDQLVFGQTAVYPTGWCPDVFPIQWTAGDACASGYPTFGTTDLNFDLSIQKICSTSGVSGSWVAGSTCGVGGQDITFGADLLNFDSDLTDVCGESWTIDGKCPTQILPYFSGYPDLQFDTAAPCSPENGCLSSTAEIL